MKIDPVAFNAITKGYRWVSDSQNGSKIGFIVTDKIGHYIGDEPFWINEFRELHLLKDGTLLSREVR